ncbi:hypothetical protein SCP_0705350 [Sparassis crispa]|uniref:FAD/NAD(P)-binding domain-containing protein n=1 Tax=Sparassis crispa TaxID=139825 RepID=A0A401GSY4_9APHY|nr:hypothetical protein SCP_0705350 [Sparassis crispa]GBE85348.1 hypothetical protein SCP_0705350 [Sparassis crispa]
MSKKNDSQKNAVIVGGGFIGSLAARELSQKLDPARYKLILINKRQRLLPPWQRQLVVTDADPISQG